mgnify:CR=1 FL=1
MIKPEEYVKLFNIKETPLIAYFEVEERKDLKRYGYPDVEMIYVNAQHFFRKSDIEKYDFSNGKILEVIKKVRELSEDLLDVSRRMKNKGDVPSFLDAFGKFMALVDLPIYLYPKFEERFFKTLKLPDEKIEILTHPLCNTYHYRRKKDLFLVKEGKMARPEFIEKWNWSEMQLFIRKNVDGKFIDEQIENLREDETFDRRDFDNIYNSLTDEHKELVDIAQKLIELRDIRIEYVLRSIYNALPHMEEYADSIGINYDSIIYMTPPEIISKKVPSDLERRKEDFAYVDHIITDKNEIKRLNDIFNSTLNIDEVKGRPVSKGFVKGRARVVFSKDDLHKVRKGDILVCDITTPDYMHALHNVSGIVANIGGFTSHTAIVSREFGIPAVIDCKNATQVFKDDDEIELDADKGVVRKIEKDT